MSIQTLKGVWWKKVDGSEKLWLGIALVWCLILFAMMPLWHLKGGQNPSFETYRLHLSSMDLVHGFSIFPLNLNFMVLPGYDYVLTITPTTSGEFYVVCNEFCGIGHHQMVGKILVE